MIDFNLIFRVIPQRRLKIHEQLQRSRRLRASIESAANLVESLPSDSPSSFPNAISILKSSLQDINQLVRLTESLCGNYTLDDTYEYNEWSAWARRQNELENEKTKREQRIIRQQLRNFSRETNPNLELNDELEAMHDSLIEKTKELADGVDFTQEDDDSEHYDVPDPKTQRKDSVASRVRAGAQSFRVAIQDSSKPDRAQFHRQELSTENDATLTPQEKKYHRRRKRKTKSNDSRDLSTSELVSSDAAAENNDVGVENNQQKKSKASKTSNSVEDKKPVAAKKSSPNENENVTSSKPGAAKISAPSPDASAPAKGTNTAKGRRKNALKVRPTKKCHHCKEQSTKYRNCNYWKLSGTKCPKAFCIECLSSKYTLGDDVQSPSNPDGIPIDEIIMCAALDLEWHCPSCLGTCLCATCVKQKKKEEEREKNRLEVDKLRKSSRRSGASYAGYNFM
ncbi:hypothetical protein ACHAXS_007550 [Conticribra weissflogii]